MNIQNRLKTLEFRPNIPLLDMEFDAKSPEIEDFIFDHAQMPDEDRSFMAFRTPYR